MLERSCHRSSNRHDVASYRVHVVGHCEQYPIEPLLVI
jgi:hypothetical protein